MRSFSKAGLAAITSATMTVATFPVIAFSVLAAELIGEFEITRAQVGILVTATGLVGALSSPFFGRVTDRIGSITSVRGVLAIGIVTLTAVAVSPSYAVLLVAAFATGIPNGWTNPATNALIVDSVPVGSRGVVTGVKQSGVQIGTFLGGLLLPIFTALWDWRIAVVAFVAIPIAALISIWGRRDGGRRHGHTERGEGALPLPVWWIAAYGTLSGLASSAIFGFLPLFAEEDQLWSKQAAGGLIAVVGLTGIASRILWPHVSERTMGHGRTLRLLAVLSTVSAGLLALAAVGAVDSWVLVPTALLFGGGAIAWNAVGMLAVMDFTPPALVGKGTGIVLLGFLGGLAGGAPLMGLSVDALGSYTVGWVTSGALLLITAVIAGRIPAGSTLADS